MKQVDRSDRNYTRIELTPCAKVPINVVNDTRLLLEDCLIYAFVFLRNISSWIKVWRRHGTLSMIQSTPISWFWRITSILWEYAVIHCIYDYPIGIPPWSLPSTINFQWFLSHSWCLSKTLRILHFCYRDKSVTAFSPSRTDPFMWFVVQNTTHVVYTLKQTKMFETLVTDSSLFVCWDIFTTVFEFDIFPEKQ